MKDLHLGLLDEDVVLGSDGEVYNGDGFEYIPDDLEIGYRDEGPDAWSNSVRFGGPTWIWKEEDGWNFSKDGITITGYCGLSTIVVNIEDNELKVTHCYGIEY